MAATVDLQHDDIAKVWGGLVPPHPEFQVRTGFIALDSSYPTGGEAVAAENFNLDDVIVMLFGRQLGYVAAWDYAAEKVIVYYGDNNNASDGPLIEVPNGTDLSTVNKIPFLAFGSIAVSHELA